MQQKQESELPNGAKQGKGAGAVKQTVQTGRAGCTGRTGCKATLEEEANMAKTQGNQAGLMKGKST